ncbi:MAG: preprotein translocase subunit YajC [Bacteroidota bacterium]|nr:preprotein translocase subunit YajC [Bacteroidota bacterium]
MLYLDILLQAGGQGNALTSLLPFLLIILVMYLFFFRPQMKKQKEENKFRNEIEKGNRIVTTSGIHGKILEVKDNYLIIESENARLKVERSAVSKELSAQYQPGAGKDEKKS